MPVCHFNGALYGAGNSNILNPLLVSHTVEVLLAFRGLGAGIEPAPAQPARALLNGDPELAAGGIADALGDHPACSTPTIRIDCQRTKEQPFWAFLRLILLPAVVD